MDGSQEKIPKESGLESSVKKKCHPLGDKTADKLKKLRQLERQGRVRGENKSSDEEWQPRRERTKRSKKKVRPPRPSDDPRPLTFHPLVASEEERVSESERDGSERDGSEESSLISGASNVLSDALFSSNSDEDDSDYVDAEKTPSSPSSYISSTSSEDDTHARECPKMRRRQMRCPVPNCTSSIQNVRRHLQLSHNFSKDRAARVFENLAERYRKRRSSKPLVKCPNCPKRVVRLDMHMASSCSGRFKGTPGKELRGLTQKDTQPMSEDEVPNPASGTSSTQCKDVGPPVSQPMSEDEVPPVLGASSTQSKHVSTCDQQDELEYMERPRQKRRRRTYKASEEIVDETKQFQGWLRSLAGGLLSEATADQYQFLMRKVFAQLGRVPTALDLSTMGDPGQAMEQFPQEHSAISTRNACIALKHYAAFQLASGKLSHEIHGTLCTVINRWMHSLRKDIQSRRQELLEQQSARIDASCRAVSAYAGSEFARHVNVFLQEYTGSVVSQSDFLDVRDHLIVTLLTENGQRSGSVCNLTLQEFEQIQEKEERFIIRVAKHKTVATFGSARLVFDQKICRQLHLYAHMRSLRMKQIGASTGTATDPFFILWTGGAIPSSHVHRIFSRVFPDIKLNPTVVRKVHYEAVSCNVKL